jgi:hypothetical protein
MWHRISPCGSQPMERSIGHLSLSHRESSMASIRQKNGIFVARFRFGGKQFQKSLRTSHKHDAEGALHLVQHTIPASAGEHPRTDHSHESADCVSVIVVESLATGVFPVTRPTGAAAAMLTTPLEALVRMLRSPRGA